jgi:hypothetical protein
MHIGYSTSVQTDCFILEDLECELSISGHPGAFEIDGIKVNGRNPFQHGTVTFDAKLAGEILDRAEHELNTYGSAFSRRVERAFADDAEGYSTAADRLHDERMEGVR